MYRFCAAAFVIMALGFRVAVTCAQSLGSGEARPIEPAAVSDPMAGFGRLVAGPWRLGTLQTNTWRWGPGRHSVREHTVGLDGEGNPWRELVIHYWRPDRETIHLLSFQRRCRHRSETSPRRHRDRCREYQDES